MVILEIKSHGEQSVIDIILTYCSVILGEDFEEVGAGVR